MLIECKDICKSYTQGKLVFPVLKNINFQMDDGEYVCIMGPSGSGKSTLMNLIGCLDKPTSGTLILDGKDVKECTDNDLADLRLQKIGFVFQNYQLLGYMTALENVALPLTYAGMSKKDRTAVAAEALEKVGLSDKLRAKPNELSGGQKQRVAIARAIANHPKILLADEPTGALDSASGEQVMDIFESLNREGTGVLMITHDRNIASHARRICDISDGILTEAGRDTVPSGGENSDAFEKPGAGLTNKEKIGGDDK